MRRISAEAESKKPTWDVDVAMVHQIFMKWAEGKDLLLPYAKELNTWKYVTSPFAKSSLGVSVEGYAMPMFHSQTALAYNPDFVKDPPKSYADLVEWVKKNPGRFGYNGLKGGMSGVAFSVGWIYWKTGKYQKYAVTGPFDKAEAATWEQALKDLGDLQKCDHHGWQRESREFKKALGLLGPRQSVIVSRRFGIGVEREYTLEEVGQMFNLTRERVRQIEQKALRLLRCGQYPPQRTHKEQTDPDRRRVPKKSCNTGSDQGSQFT